ncbi:MAG TPA: DUF167 domain-containing protein [Candidatus Gracilibacteria bacterium]|nr:DUF167 domain-containing protein [Candidatus Gracilibacteria bacterium]
MIQNILKQLHSQKSVTFQAKITPKSGKHEISGIMANGTVKIKLKAAPEQGKANEELVELLADELNLSKKNITIIKGQTSPKKTIQINQ